MTDEPVSPDAEAAGADVLPYNRLSWWLDRLVAGVGRWCSWLWLAVLAVVLSNVFSRFVMNEGSIALEELSWHFFGAAMMLTLGYAVVRDDHVRVDVLREKFSLKAQAWIELVAIVLLALPILYLMIDALVPYAYKAYTFSERSQAPSGLPHRFIFKSVLPLGLMLVAVALFSRGLRCATFLFRFPREIQPGTDERDGAHPHP
ncbi:TRAP transporter small permease subunit [Alloalcanivorax xenomutans]|uniref:TRAP transporter small permease subunit n=1 Tax=Alloalcanivorax xenomutans TaxID=1094342 RepID=UPI0003B7F9D4|nr:TRAP transporter small permease subunit [Alloalcanivorax xenomutans]ERS15328.1 C4-dicarboxylate ABC transporter substrate-binding protein [Alcanivorax sp. PN-3]KYZ84439.1 C4-dicarboxylate ABC transporter permease [Alcanivorax sp. KX64203]MBA4719967.1 TRAP transporter small permease subunit [Alcanivorax sp.]ARB44567.1 C4-dicarboxylate ABC transporter permease [Alloalcanivorax xenomutans]PHS58214.1 MAG: C4-dicarboxylate ABC transporter permease [Alcanivorax sp.]